MMEVGKQRFLQIFILNSFIPDSSVIFAMDCRRSDSISLVAAAISSYLYLSSIAV